MLHSGAIYFMVSVIWLHALAFFLAMENQIGSAGSWNMAGRAEDFLVSFLMTGTWIIFSFSYPTGTTANNTQAVRSLIGIELCLKNTIKFSFFHVYSVFWNLMHGQCNGWNGKGVKSIWLWHRDMWTREDMRENAYSCNCRCLGSCYWIGLYLWIKIVWYGIFSFLNFQYYFSFTNLWCCVT